MELLWEAEALICILRSEVRIGPPLPGLIYLQNTPALEGFAGHLAINGIAWIHLLLACILEQENFGLSWITSEKIKANNAKAEEPVEHYQVVLVIQKW